MSWGASQEQPSGGAPVVGMVLGERYQLIAPIAAGGMAQVWSARDTHLNRDVAAKILHPHLLTDDGFVTRFRREAVAAARLQHRSIVSVYDTISGNGTEAIVMELIEGETLRTVLDEQGALSARHVMHIGRQIAEALAVAHAAGLVHRDIKPANIMIRADHRVLVTDFGIAKAADDADLTNTGTLLGTAKYLSPEQVTGGPVDPRSDLYSLGVVLFEALAGSVPFKAGTDAATALARLHTEAPRVSSLRPNVPAALDQLVARLMARDLRHRPATATDVAEALATIDPLGPPSRPPQPPGAGAGGADGPSPTPGNGAGPPRRPPDPPQGTTAGPSLRPPDPPRTPVTAAGSATNEPPPTERLALPSTGAAGPAGPSPHTPAGPAPARQTPPPAATAPVGTGQTELPTGPAVRDPSVELLGTSGQVPAAGDTPTPAAADGAPVEQVGRSRVGRWAVLAVVAAGLVAFGVWLSGAGPLGDPNPFVEGSEGLPVIDARSFDPLTSDDTKEEREELVPNAYDGDRETAWTTEPYRRRGLSGLKEGVGILLTLEEALPLNQAEIDSRADDWSAELYVADAFTDDPDDWGEPTAVITAASGLQLVDLDRAEGSMVLLWITDTGVSEAGRNQFVLGEIIIR